MSHVQYLNQQITEDTAIDRMKPKRLRWRVYFNCRDHFPFLAAVDNGTIASQIRVQFARMENVGWIEGKTDMGPNVQRNDPFDPTNPPLSHLRSWRKGKPNEPTWWLEFEATAVFADGGVVFYGDAQ